MAINSNTGLVLEGGGQRGVFTIGVLDYMMDAGLTFSYGIGVSAGACHGMSFVSGQRGRARKCAIDILKYYKYVGLKHLWHTHAILDQELLYDRLPNELIPFDYEAAFSSPMRFEMVTTNCLTGRAEYLTETSSRERILAICKASSSLPFVSPICPVDDIPMLDGGIVDPIPTERALQQGCQRLVVVLTHEHGYRDGKDIKVPRFIYKNYPRLRVVLSRMRRVYNEKIALVERLEESGIALCIRPERAVEVDRLETNTDKLRTLYEAGYATAQQVLTSDAARPYLSALAKD